MKSKSLFFVFLAAIFFITGCYNVTDETLDKNAPNMLNTELKTPESNSLMVFAAGSLTQPFTELGTMFEAQHPGIKVVFDFQNANTLALQIGQGAPADVFASAAEKFMTSAVNTGRINEKDVNIFARNKLAVIIPKNNPANIIKLTDLAKPGIKLVMGAKEGPQGAYVENFLSNTAKDPEFPPDFKDLVYKNVVSFESTVNGVVTKVSLGEADAGFVYYSDSQGNAEDKVDVLEIPIVLNIDAQYPIAPLNESNNIDLAKSYIDLVLSQSGQDVLTKYGFLPAK